MSIFQRDAILAAPVHTRFAPLTAALVTLSSTVSADAPRVLLKWTAPEGCPAGARVTAEVDRLLGDAGARPPTPLEVRAAVTEDAAGGFRVRVETDREGATRVRELRAQSCEALADATAVILALMIDPAAVAAAPPAPSPPASAPAPPIVGAPSNSRPEPVLPPPGRLSPPPTPPPRPTEVRFHLATWALADAGSLPGVSFAAGGAAGLSIGAVRIELGAGAWPARAAPIAARPTAGGDVSLIAGSAGACYDFLDRDGFSLGPCAAVELGRLHAAGYGVTTPGDGSALWSAGKAGAWLAWAPARRFAISLKLDAVVPFARPSFVLENVGPVHRAGAVVGRAGGGVEVRF